MNRPARQRAIGNRTESQKAKEERDRKRKLELSFGEPKAGGDPV